MPAVLAFIQLVLPTVLTSAPNLILLFRSAFVEVGGDGADYDKILTDNGADIAILQHPDQLRHNIHST